MSTAPSADPVVLGTGPAGGPIWWQPATTAHLSVSGPAGAGTTTAVQGVATSALMHGWQVHAAVMHHGREREWAPLRPWLSGFHTGTAKLVEAAREFLAAADRPHATPLLFVIDDLGLQLSELSTAEADQLIQVMAVICEHGPSFGAHVLFGDTVPAPNSTVAAWVRNLTAVVGHVTVGVPDGHVGYWGPGLGVVAQPDGRGALVQFPKLDPQLLPWMLANGRTG